jgi:hypothetical protein
MMSRKFWYSLIVAAVVVSVGITLTSAQVAKKSLNEGALIDQLQALRTSVVVYKVKTKNFPDNLHTAIREIDSAAPGIWTVDEKNSIIIDPFGNPYYYDSSTGHVNTTTSAYNNW